MRILFWLALIVSALVATPALAALTPYYPDVPPDCGPISSDRPCYYSGGTYIQCTAKGSEGQKCQTTVYVNNQPTCASVDRSASCQCNETTKKSTGSCQYYK